MPIPGSYHGEMRGRSAPAHPEIRPPSLVELCSEILSLAYSLKTNPDIGEPAEVRRKVLELLDRMENEGRKLGYAAPVTEGARFALVALIDETILSSQWPGRDAWRTNPLQRELFKMNVAGEEFYTRLDQLRQNPGENRALLEVYYAVLIMGFEGRYMLLGREKLESLIRGIANELSGGRPWTMEAISPDWRRPDDTPEVVGEGVPVWATILGILGIALVMVLIFRFVAVHESGQLAQKILGYLPPR